MASQTPKVNQHILTETELAGLSSVAVASAHQRSLELLRINLRGTKNRPVIEVILDGERQVSIDDCEAVSKDVQAHLDKLLGTETNYRLDVLSPGLDEPLVFPYQFRRSLGRKIEVQSEHGLKTGILKEITVDGVSIEEKPKGKSKEITGTLVFMPFAEIKKALVQAEL